MVPKGNSPPLLKCFEGVGEMYREAMADHPDKPVLSYIMGAETKQQWLEELENTAVPVYDSAYEAIDTLDKMYWWHRYANGVENYDTSVADSSKTI